ncbi:MAG TPA: DoxX family protein [Candidatus Tectomicrobia bacterium]|nr:DoxX family protein [Candidatus Tectomicrobia bacterium]
MSVLEAALTRARPVVAWLSESTWIPALLVRLVVGYFFFETGWAKAGDLDAMVERFVGWGIPFPALSVGLSVYTELIGGALLMLGLATRLVAIPLFINMAVALGVVAMRNVETLEEFVEEDEPLYMLFFLWLFFAGPGRISLDHLIARRWGWTER